MPLLFKTILVPVDFSISSEVAIHKALEIADPEFASVHLVHVRDHTQGRTKRQEKEGINAQYVLAAWKDSIEKEYASVTVHNWVLSANPVQEAIASKGKELKADIIVIGKKSRHAWFPFLNTISPVELSALTDIAVLTVKPGSMHNKIRTMVVPVIGDLAESKTEAIAALCKKYRVKVHLVTFSKNGANSEGLTSSFLQMYQWIKNTLHCSVECTSLNGTNKARSILSYAEKINADVLLLHPETETKIGWPNTHISDVLSPQSKVQVLTIQPIQ